MKRIFAFLLLLTLSLGILSPVMAQEKEMPKEVNSFELFWPISAGKTLGDSLYGLKTFKEKIRGTLIFGKVQKVDYSLFLATKRVVEAEKLFKEGKIELAKKTLVKMEEALNTALANVDIPKEQKNKGEVDELNNKLNNLEIFLQWLETGNEGAKEEITSLLTKVQEINSKL